MSSKTYRGLSLSAYDIVTSRISGPVHVTEVTGGVEPIPHALFQGLGIREAAVPLAIPQDIPVIRDLEYTARPWKQRNFAEVITKGGE